MNIFTKVILFLALATSLFAQQPPKDTTDHPRKDVVGKEERAEESFYKLTFAVYELENGKRVNQRDYSMTGKTNSGESSRISVTTRVPVYSEEKKMQYVDAGLTLNCSLRDQATGKLQVQCTANISNFVRPEELPESRSSSVSAPIMRSTNINTWSILTPGKPAIIASVDDINSAKRMQIEVTATKLD